MLKITIQFLKVTFLLCILIILNPHRAILIPFQILAAFGSWLAWKLEDGCQWLADKIGIAKENFWLFGKSINKRLDDEMTELNRMAVEVDKKVKAE